MRKIKLFEPKIGNSEYQAVKKTLASKFWASGSGTGKVLEFEERFREYIGMTQCTSVNSGTAALHLALNISKIKDSEVILPSLSFVSTAHAVIYNGAKPVFVDVNPNTLCIDPEQISEAITKKTKVILPVHFGGMSSDIEKIQKICSDNDLLLIEDAAHATGAIYNNKKIGSHGDHVCFSFHPIKNLAMPSGGAIASNGVRSEKEKRILSSLRWCGIANRNGPNYEVPSLGWNYYMNEISAAIGLEQLKKLDNMNSKRRRIAKRYSDELKISKKMPFEKGCVYHLFWVQLKNRTEFMKLMLKNGVETGIHFKPIHKMKLYRNHIRLKNTEEAARRIVSLPMHPNLSDDDVSYVIKLVNKFAK